MRRPICLASLLYAAAVLLFLLFSPPQAEDYSEYNKETITLQGTVLSKEYKAGSDGTVKLLITLKGCREVPAPNIIVSGSSVSSGTQDTNSSGICPSGNVLCRVGDGTKEDALRADGLTRIGSTVQIRGKLRTFSKATNDGEFDSQRYYRTLGYTSFALNNAEVTAYSQKSSRGLLHSQNRGWGLLYRLNSGLDNTLYLLKRFLAGILDQSMNEEDASILKAMLLGEKGYLTTQTRDLYRNSGIIHILAISGLHVSLMGMGLFRLLRKIHLPRLPSAIISVTFILLYGRMIGLGASSFRAVFMFLLHMLAIVLHRTYDLLTALSLAAMLLLIRQPLFLLDSGFQFSFGAVLGIALLMPAFDSRIMKILSVTLATIPVYLLSYGTFPIWSILLNLAVIPLMSVVMVSGLLVLALGSINPFLGAGPGFITHMILLFYKAICEVSSRLPGHQLNIGAPSAWQLILYLMVLALIAAAGDHMPETVKTLAAVLSLIFLCFRCQTGLDVKVIDVGQGDGILIQCDGTNILIDGGSTGKTELSRYQLTPLLQHDGIRKLDYCIVTHEDEDHISGTLEIIEESRTHSEISSGSRISFFSDDSTNGLTIGALCLPSCAEEMKTENYRKLEQAAVSKNIPVIYLKEGDRLTAGTGEKSADGTESFLCLTCLHPEQDSTYSEPNERSTVLYLTYGSFSMLLTGDLEEDGEARLLEYLNHCQADQDITANSGQSDPREISGQTDVQAAADRSSPLCVTLLKVAHHGSSGATSEAFLDAVHPQYAVISCGVNNRYGHPHEETLERLSDSGVSGIYDTRYDGEIRFHTNGQTLTVTCKGGELE